MQKGDRVIIVKSWSSDVIPGALGTLVKRMKGGYAVDVAGWFHDAFGRRIFETRCMFFKRKEVKNLNRHRARPPKAVAGKLKRLHAK